MSRGLATLSINLEARLAELQEGFDKAARVADKNASLIEARYNKLASTAAAVGAAFAGAFAADRLVQFFRTTLDGLDALNDLADATGASVENLSALEDIAARTGTAFDAVGSALVKFNAQLAQARAGSETAETLKRLGLNAEELRRLDPAEALQRTAVALAGFADDGNKARLVQELFGKSVREVAPLLKDLAEAGKLNASVTRAQVEEADRLSKALSNLGREAEQAKRRILGPFIAAADQFFRLQDQVKAAGFKDVLQASFSFNTTELQSLDNLNQRLAGIVGRYVELKQVVDAAAAAGKAPPQEFLRELQNLERQERFIRILQKERGGGREDGPRSGSELPVLPDVTDRAIQRGAAAKPISIAGTVLDPLTAAALKRLENTDTARLGQLRLELQALLEVGGDTEGGNQGDALRALREEIARLDPEQQKLAANRARLNQLLADTPTGRLTAALADIELLNAELARSPEALEQWAEAVRGVTARLPQDTAEALDELSDITKNFQRNVQDVLGDNIASALRGDFDSIEDAWKTMLLNMAAQAAAAELSSRLFGADGRGGWAAQLAGFFGFAKGGAFSQGQPITAFADGGVLTRPTFFGMGGGRMGVAGEAGYEGVLPLRRGPNGRLGVEAYGGGGVTVVNNVAAGMTRGEVVAAIQLGMDATKADLVSTLRAARVL
ncbi:MAG: phage tail tape measure protein [Betaproteobacteria bacterium]|jgi:hypothetical protein|nr:hypothetical protein [Rubrivivax sp.]